jgi:AcrR family transcriptional regulator
MPARLTRKEKQARTRQSLLSSAAKLFACHGMQQASIDDVAEDAGYTKGAFYANFKSKEELFLAMLDERFSERLEEIDRAAHAGGGLEDQARQAAVDFMRAIGADEEWKRLFFEFAAYATRNDDFRQELVTRYRTLRKRIAELYEERAAELGLELPVPAADLALMTFAMANGIAMERLLEPEMVSEEVYGTMMAIFFGGLRAMAEAPASRPA